MPSSPRQQKIFADILADINLYLTRVIALPDFSTRLQDAIEELELDDKILLRKLLDCWTTLELIATTGGEHDALKEISATLNTLRDAVRGAAGQLKSVVASRARRSDATP